MTGGLGLTQAVTHPLPGAGSMGATPSPLPSGSGGRPTTVIGSLYHHRAIWDMPPTVPSSWPPLPVDWVPAAPNALSRICVLWGQAYTDYLEVPDDPPTLAYFPPWTFGVGDGPRICPPVITSGQFVQPTPTTVETTLSVNWQPIDPREVIGSDTIGPYTIRFVMNLYASVFETRIVA